MPNGPKGGLDRRDFMILALGSVGATAAASVNADAAMAQDATVSSAAPGTGVQQGTVYTGDVIQGKKVISTLDVNDLEPGKHLFYFQGVQMPRITPALCGERYAAIARTRQPSRGRPCYSSYTMRCPRKTRLTTPSKR